MRFRLAYEQAAPEAAAAQALDAELASIRRKDLSAEAGVGLDRRGCGSDGYLRPAVGDPDRSRVIGLGRFRR